jgi:hypothetical protein
LPDGGFELLTTRPRLQGAVVLEPLRRAALESYLDQHSERLAGLRAALTEDEQLWEVLDTPLFLDLLTRMARDGGLEGSATRTQILAR